MPLTPGQPLAHYRIDRKIGEGGMGEVWAATDTRLNREAAIKTLPASVAGDAERLSRFKREAQLLAALSHPNIAAVYGLEEVDAVPYLALELVEGDDLSARIQGTPLPVDEAVEIAGQIAAALEEAHGAGIIHRDLKPANVKVTPDGKVKVLDFGLAKALSGDPATSGSVDPSYSPTITHTMGTQAGMILGTAAYMSPEQARGKTVDRRADIWAFGVILFEMLTGERMYTGETATDVIASVVTREPDWEKLPDETPAAIRRLLRRCLQKDPRRRLRDIGDAALELTEEPADLATPPVAPTATSVASNRRVWLAALAGLVLGLVGAVAIQTARAPVDDLSPEPTWSVLPPPVGSEYDFARFLEISPDGRRVVFVAPAPDGSDPQLLWVRELASERPRPLTGTEGATQPFWSPDGNTVAYFARGKLRRISADGGVPTTLAGAGTDARGGSGGADVTLLYGPNWSQPLFSIPASGGTPVAVTEFNTERMELSHRWPHLLPDGRHFLYYVVSTYPALNPENPSELDKSGLYLGSLDGAEPRLLQTARSRAVYVGGSLLFVDDGNLMARPFDLQGLTFHGDPVPLAEDVTQSVDSLWGGALFSVSDEGTLLFVRGAPQRHAFSQFQWRDRDGNDLGTVGEPASYRSMQISHDGRRVATSIGDPADIWIHDLERGTSTRFTFDPGDDNVPLWSPDDDRVLFQSSRVIAGRRFTPANLFQRVTSGLEPEQHLETEEFGSSLMPGDWSPDGRLVTLTTARPGTGSDLMIYSFEDGSVEPYLVSDHDEEYAQFSPNGRWLAYQSSESGRYEIYVQPYPGPGGKWQLSSDGGRLPVWRTDGKELFYVDADGLMAVPVETEGSFRHQGPVRLFTTEVYELPSGLHSYGVAPDGERFLFLDRLQEDGAETGTVTLLQGWRGLVD